MPLPPTPLERGGGGGRGVALFGGLGFKVLGGLQGLWVVDLGFQDFGAIVGSVPGVRGSGRRIYGSGSGAGTRPDCRSTARFRLYRRVCGLSPKVSPRTLNPELNPKP